MLWQLDTTYGTEADTPHPLVGRFVPTGTVETTAGRTPLLEYLRDARWVAIQTAPIFDARVERLDALVVPALRIDGAGEAGGLLIRPDGHVAWAGSTAEDPALAAAIDAWTRRTSPEMERAI